jgi:hypothetical protein
VVDYKSHDSIICRCVDCGATHSDNHRNLSYKKFYCKYCDLRKYSNIIKDGYPEILEIKSNKIRLRCENGHEYIQLRGNLLAGKKCQKCYLENKIFTLDKVMCEFNRVHGNFYKYKMDNYKNLHSKIEITCKNDHTFLQKVSNHIQGKGCPICRESLGERIISKYLQDNKIKYERQKKFKDCKYVSHLPFDFFLTDLNTLIEFDGIQHYKPIKQFGGDKEFNKTKIKDEIKNKYCLDNKIKLIRISYQDNILDCLNCIQEDIIL